MADSRHVHFFHDDFTARVLDFLAIGVEIINVHIAAPTAHPFWAQPRRRYRQLRGLLSHLEATPDRQRVVIGDFNSTPLFPLHRSFARRMDDVPERFASTGGGRPVRTWRRWPIGPRLLRLDHCFASGGIAEHVEVLDVKGSDHDALLVDLSVE